MEHHLPEVSLRREVLADLGSLLVVLIFLPSAGTFHRPFGMAPLSSYLKLKLSIRIKVTPGTLASVIGTVIIEALTFFGGKGQLETLRHDTPSRAQIPMVRE